MTDKMPPGNRERLPNPEEMPWVWEQLDRARKTWVITGPIHAVVTNWKAIVVVVATISAISVYSDPAILAAIANVIGGEK